MLALTVSDVSLVTYRYEILLRLIVFYLLSTCIVYIWLITYCRRGYSSKHCHTVIGLCYSEFQIAQLIKLCTQANTCQMKHIPVEYLPHPGSHWINEVTWTSLPLCIICTYFCYITELHCVQKKHPLTVSFISQ